MHWDLFMLCLGSLAAAAAAARYARQARADARAIGRAEARAELACLLAEFSLFKGQYGARLLKLDALVKDVLDQLDRLPGLRPLTDEEMRRVQRELDGAWSLHEEGRPGEEN